MKNEPLLKVENLSIGFPRHGKLHPVVNQVSFHVNQGEILGIAGESGSGKSISALAVMSLLPKTAKVISGSISFLGEELIGASSTKLRELKGTQMAMIFQEPMTSFNPVQTIGAQVEEMLSLHQKCSKKEYKERTLLALTEAGLEDVENIYYKYPHQLSGGMRQRAMIAMAMIAGPKLLIADEPTTALDVSIQDKILKLLKKINQDFGTSIILVSHDLGVIKSICGRVLVMKEGNILETGMADQIFDNPQMEYTKLLAAAAPAAWSRQLKLNQNNIASSDVRTTDVISLQEESKTINKINNDKNQDNLFESQVLQSTEVVEKYVLQVKNLNVSYEENSKGLWKGKHKKQVVKNASLSIKYGETLGIVGESGCGKSTLSKAIAGLVKDATGYVQYSDDQDKSGSNVVNRPQMVFQDPYGSLNPVKKIGWILEEPLRISGGLTKIERKNRVKEVIMQVGLEEKHLGRYVSQLSGGQRQRVAIAAAVILNPKLIILDEPVSSLDVTVQAQILSLLKDLQRQYHLSYLFISHDLNVIYQVCNRVCVMYQGEIIETRDTKALFTSPQQEYTKTLLRASIPDND